MLFNIKKYFKFSEYFVDCWNIIIDNINIFQKGECKMNLSLNKVFRMTVGANVLLLLTFLFLPVLLITNDISIIQSAIDFINKEWIVACFIYGKKKPSPWKSEGYFYLWIIKNLMRETHLFLNCPNSWDKQVPPPYALPPFFTRI